MMQSHYGRSNLTDLVAVDMDLSAGHSMGDHLSSISLVEESEK